MTEKLLYVAPECVSIAVAPQEVIAASPTLSMDPGNPFGTTPDEVQW